MKMSNKNIFKVVLIVLLIGMIGTFTHCVQVAKEIGDGGGSSSSSSFTNNTPPPKSEGQIINETQVTTGVKNHEQILMTMGTVTGIDPFGNNSIMNIYRQVETSLPTDNDIKIYSATQQVAVTKLAAEFCNALTTTTYATQRATVWPGLNLATVSGTMFNAQNEAAFIQNTINSFWGGVLSSDELIMAKNELSLLIDDLINNENSATATQRTVRGVCTAALSSAYVTLL